LVERKFSLYDVEQFIREAGATRVTEDAVIELERELEKLAEKVAKRAKQYAVHAGRKRLIRSADILLTEKSSPSDYSTPANFRPRASTTKSASTAHR
jgi:DNA-binding protein